MTLNEERTGFALRIVPLRILDGEFEWKLQSINQGVPNETIIMQLKAFLRNLKQDYFNSFNARKPN